MIRITPGPGVLDAVDAPGRQVEARARLERHLVAADVRDALALDDVADLVVGMAVVGRAAGLDDADELRQLALVQDAERPLRVGALLLPVGEARDDPLALDLVLRPARRPRPAAGSPSSAYASPGRSSTPASGSSWCSSPSRWSVPEPEST